MSTVRSEIAKLEERLRLAELGPDPMFFEEALDDDAVIVSQNGQCMDKARIVEAHQPGKGPKFNSVEISDLRIIDHEGAAVVTCTGSYHGPEWSGTLKFMRVWMKKRVDEKNDRWKIIAASISG